MRIILHRRFHRLLFACTAWNISKFYSFATRCQARPKLDRSHDLVKLIVERVRISRTIHCVGFLSYVVPEVYMFATNHPNDSRFGIHGTLDKFASTRINAIDRIGFRIEVFVHPRRKIIAATAIFCRRANGISSFQGSKIRRKNRRTPDASFWPAMRPRRRPHEGQHQAKQQMKQTPIHDGKRSPQGGG